MDYTKFTLERQRLVSIEGYKYCKWTRVRGYWKIAEIQSDILNYLEEEVIIFMKI